MAGLEHLIPQAVAIAGITDYTGTFHALGGGMVNDTFKLECEKRDLILRITRWAGRDTLRKEAKALAVLHIPEAPELVFFDKDQLLDGHYWVIETFVGGKTPERLTAGQFRTLGRVLAGIHSVKAENPEPMNPWQQFLTDCRNFGTEAELLAHQDPGLRELIVKGRQYILDNAALVQSVVPCLTHGDVTHSNMLVQGDSVKLIDWEFARFTDPMRDFTMLYFDDLETNKGKWRIKITPEEKQALFEDYQAAGGVIDLPRLDYWMLHAKLSTVVFFYWRLHKYHEPMTEEQKEQFSQDLQNLTASLQRELA
jgi:aminoglycoside phosphotransferase (APT) family kinase protein